MSQFYIPDITEHQEIATITKQSEVRHILKSHRKKVKDIIKIFNGKGWVFKAEIEETFKDKIICKIIEKKYIKPKSYKIILAQAAIKLDKFEFVLQKATELGVDEILPVMLERSECNIQTYINKHDRFESIIVEAAKQSERVYIPILHTPIYGIKKVFDEKDNCLTIVSYKEVSNTINNYIDEIKKSATLRIIIGPEGDLSYQELEFLRARKDTIFLKISENILRSETAAILLVGLITQIKEYF